LTNQNYSSAEENLNKALEIDENNVEALLGLAEIAIITDGPDKAIEVYREVIQIEPDNEKAHKSLLNLYIEIENYSEAENEINSLYRLKLSDPMLYTNAGKKLFNKKNYVLSAACFQNVIELDPENIEALRSLSQCNMEENDFLNTIIENKKIISLFPTDESAHMTIGIAYYKLKNYNLAAKWLKKSLKLNSEENNKETIHTILADCYINSGKYCLTNNQYKYAEEYFREAINMDPKNYSGHKELAYLYLYKGKEYFNDKKYDFALKYFDKIIKLNVDREIKETADSYIAKIDTINTDPYYENYNSGYSYNPVYYEPPNDNYSDGGVIDAGTIDVFPTEFNDAGTL